MKNSKDEEMQCCDLCTTYHADMSSIDTGGNNDESDIRHICDDCLVLIREIE